MSKLLACAVAASIGAAGLTSKEMPSQYSSACRAADNNTAFEIGRLQKAMHGVGSADSVAVANANLLYVADSAFAVVTDSATCATALAAHNAEAGYTPSELTNPASGTLYVIRVGTRFITWNPSFPSGEFVNHIVWDSSFHLLDNYLG